MSTSDFNTNSKLILDKIEEALIIISQQKEYIVRLKQYEKAAELRDIEKTFIEIKDKLKKHRLPAYLDQYYDQL